MRLEADMASPTNDAPSLGVNPHYIHVYLDGVRQDACIWADDQEGTMCCFSMLKGELVKVAGKNLRTVKRGRVHFELQRTHSGGWPHPGIPDPGSRHKKTPETG